MAFEKVLFVEEPDAFQIFLGILAHAAPILVAGGAGRKIAPASVESYPAAVGLPTAELPTVETIGHLAMAKLIKTKPRTAAGTAAEQVACAAKIAGARSGPSRAGDRRAAPTRPPGRPSVPADLRTQVRQILRGLAKTYPDATCALKHESAYQLIVATILSAQCTDERVNMVTPTLFAKYPDVESLAAATQAELEEIIRSTGFFRAKAASLRGMAQGVVRAVRRPDPQVVGRPGDASRRGTQDGQCRPGNRVGHSERRRRRHARQADHDTVGAHQEHVGRADRARLDADHPAERMGQFLAPVDPSRAADLHRAAAQMPGVSPVELLPPRRAAAAQMTGNVRSPATLHGEIAAANVVGTGGSPRQCLAA